MKLAYVLALGLGFAASAYRPALAQCHDQKAAVADIVTSLPHLPSSKLGGLLRELITEPDPEDPLLRILLPIVADTWVVIDFVAVDDVQALREALEPLGLRNAAMYGRVVSGMFPIAELGALEWVPELKFARASLGTTVSAGDAAIWADRAREHFAVDGTGVTIGVVSDSFDCLGGGRR